MLNPLISLIRATFRTKGSLEHTQKGPARALETRTVLEAMVNAGPNASRSGVKFVHHLYRADEPVAAVREELDPDTLCLGTICYSEFAPTTAEKVTVLVYDPAPDAMQVWLDGSFQGLKIGGRWAVFGSEDAAGAAYRLFDPLDPVGYIVGEIVRYAEGEVTQFAEARKAFTLAAYPGGYPAPTGTATDANWRPVSPPNPTYRPFRSVTHAVLLAALDGGLEPGQTYEVTDRPGDGAVVYAVFDTDATEVSEFARVQGQPGLWRYDVVADALTPLDAELVERVTDIESVTNRMTAGAYYSNFGNVQYHVSAQAALDSISTAAQSNRLVSVNQSGELTLPADGLNPVLRLVAGTFAAEAVLLRFGSNDNAQLPVRQFVLDGNGRGLTLGVAQAGTGGLVPENATTAITGTLSNRAHLHGLNFGSVPGIVDVLSGCSISKATGTGTIYLRAADAQYIGTPPAGVNVVPYPGGGTNLPADVEAALRAAPTPNATDRRFALLSDLGLQGFVRRGTAGNLNIIYGSPGNDCDITGSASDYNTIYNGGLCQIEGIEDAPTYNNVIQDCYEVYITNGDGNRFVNSFSSSTEDCFNVSGEDCSASTLADSYRIRLTNSRRLILDSCRDTVIDFSNDLTLTDCRYCRFVECTDLTLTGRYYETYVRNVLQGPAGSGSPTPTPTSGGGWTQGATAAELSTTTAYRVVVGAASFVNAVGPNETTVQIRRHDGNAAFLAESTGASGYTAFVAKGSAEADLILQHTNAPAGAQAFYFRVKNGAFDVINLSDGLNAINNYVVSWRANGRMAVGFGAGNESEKNFQAALNVGGTAAVPAIRASADIEITDAAFGLVLKSPNGQRWRLQPSNTGQPIFTAV
jgi:hypothetical protein